MEYIGLDLHQRATQLCILTEAGPVLERRIRTEPARFAAVLRRPRARILLEASTESEWVARCLEALGHEVIVADPSDAPMDATQARRIKTDQRDARALAEACRAGTYRPAHRLSDARRHLRAELMVREGLVRTRTRYAILVRTLARRDGVRLPSGSAAHLVARLAAHDVPAPLRAELAPLVALLAPLQQEIDAADRRLATLVAADPVMRRLTTVPGVGPVTAAAFVAALDDVTRFARAHEVEAYLGLVPSERSSGERQRRGAITTAGNPRVRWLRTEAAWNVLRSRHADTVALRAWATRIAARRGKGHRRHRPGASPRGHPLRALARRHELRSGPRRRGGVATQHSGRALVTTSGGERGQATWPPWEAVEQRAPPPIAPTHAPRPAPPRRARTGV